jgi:hypothetical protein
MLFQTMRLGLRHVIEFVHFPLGLHHFVVATVCVSLKPHYLHAKHAGLQGLTLQQCILVLFLVQFLLKTLAPHRGFLDLLPVSNIRMTLELR